MSGRSIIAVGASAGGVEALRDLLRGLPPDFPASLLIVLHSSADPPRVLPDVLGRAAILPVAYARGGERILPGHVYECLACSSAVDSRT